jgi:hypothetical protein
MAILDKSFGAPSGPANMPNKFGTNSQSPKAKPADKYSSPYKQPDYKTGPQVMKPAAGSSLLSVLETMRRQKAQSPAGRGLAGKGTSPDNSQKLFLKRGEIRKELRKETMGISLAEKEKIIPKKYGAYITKSEIKRAEKELHRQYLKTGGLAKVAAAKEEKILKKLEKKLKQL